MLDTEPAWQRRRLDVPRGDCTVFADPQPADAMEAARETRSRLDRSQLDLQGRTLGRLRAWSRQAVLEAARQYTSELTGAGVPAPAADLLFVAGHQPSLFHPGVWIKNFMIGCLAAHAGGASLNLVVDNDTFSSTQIRLPAGTRDEPVYETAAFDQQRRTQPWEDAAILDVDTFRTFGERVGRAMGRWNIEPVVAEFWPEAVAYSRTSPLLRDCLTAARNRLERRWGVENLELPLSRLCTLDPFLWFASQVFAQLPRFRDVHNQVLTEFRRVNKIRSRTHPVADLKEADGWHEAPFWVWRSGDLVRKRVFARQVGQEVRLSDGGDVFASLRLSPEMDACCAVENLRELPSRGIHLRTRALTTTLFARLCLGDLFIHGIGGAKYDEMTDRILLRFFHIAPPPFMTLSAGLHLPLAEPHNVQPGDETRLKTLLRDLDYNSDRHLAPGTNAEADALIAEKRNLIGLQHAARTSHLSHRERRARSRDNYERFCRLREIDARLSAFTQDQRRRLEEELFDVRRQLAANAVLQNREFAFCLFPEEKLRQFLAEACGRAV